MLAALLLNLGTGPTPPPVQPGRPVFGAPIYWPNPWTDEDERKLRRLKQEQKKLQNVKDIELPALIHRPDVGRAQQARLDRILARLEYLEDAIVKLEIKRAEDEEMEDFMMAMMAIGD